MNNYYPNPYLMPRQSIPQVNGFKGAEMYQMGVNSQAMMLDTDMPICYIKETDGAGYPTIKAYDLVPHKDEQTIQQESILSRLQEIEERLSRNESITKESKSVDESTNATDAGAVQGKGNDSTTARYSRS